MARPGSPRPLGPAHALSPVELKRIHAASRDGRAFLYWRDAAGTLVIVHLEGTRTYVVGRGRAVDVNLDHDQTVSTLHTELACVGGTWVAADDGFSLNGTYVDGCRVIGRRRLRDGHVVRVGATTIAFIGTGAERAATPTLETGPEARLPSCDAIDRAILRELCRPYFINGSSDSMQVKNIGARLRLSKDAVQNRLGVMYRECQIYGIRGENKNELMRRVIDHGVISRRDYH